MSDVSNPEKTYVAQWDKARGASAMRGVEGGEPSEGAWEVASPHPECQQTGWWTWKLPRILCTVTSEANRRPQVANSPKRVEFYVELLWLKCFEWWRIPLGRGQQHGALGVYVCAQICVLCAPYIGKTNLFFYVENL